MFSVDGDRPDEAPHSPVGREAQGGVLAARGAPCGSRAAPGWGGAPGPESRRPGRLYGSQAKGREEPDLGHLTWASEGLDLGSWR